MAERIAGRHAGRGLIGFHIQAHCNNFLETVDRALESRVDREHFAVKRGGHSTFVQAVSDQRGFSRMATTRLGSGGAPYVLRSELLSNWASRRTFGRRRGPRGLHERIPERLRGIERFLEKYPAYREKFTFIQIGAPSRTRNQALSRSTGGSGSGSTASMPAGKQQVEADRIPARGITVTKKFCPTTGRRISAW